MTDPIGVTAATLDVVADPTKELIGLAVTTTRGQTVAIHISAAQANDMVIHLLQELYDFPKRLNLPEQRVTFQGFRCRATHVIGEGDRGGAVLLDIGPVRLPLLLDIGSMETLARQLSSTAALLGPPKGTA